VTTNSYVVRADGALGDCFVRHADPVGVGFEEAAVTLSRHFRMQFVRLERPAVSARVAQCV
jgi:hypothetical protein